MHKNENAPVPLTCLTISSCVIASPAQPAVIGTSACLDKLPYIAEFINYYFSTRCRCTPKIMRIARALASTGCRIILATREDAEINGVKVDEIKHDGFVLRTKEESSGNLLIYCVGNNAQGIKYALYRLIMESQYAAHTLFLTGPLNINVSPLFEKRVIIESPSSPLDVSFLNGIGSSSSPLDVWKEDLTASKKYYPAWWDEAKNRTWVKMIDSFGFNALELGFVDNAHSWLSVAPDQAIHSIKTRLQENKRLGNDNLLFVWGALIYSKAHKRWNGHVCFNSPQGAKEALEYYDYLAGEFGSLADCVLTHWGDPGGCTSSDCACNIKTPPEYHNRIQNAFRKHNRKIKSIFSLWALKAMKGEDWGWSWKHISGTEDIDILLDSGILADDAGIAIHQSGCTPPHGIWLDYLKKVIRTKRTAGMWVWYLFDYEVIPGLHINYDRGAKYLNDLAETDYAKHIQWSQCETNRSGDWNTVSTLVGGMLMLDIRLAPDRLAREFCAGIAGEENATKVKKALDAIRQTRNDTQTAFGKGSDDPRRDYQLADDALKDLENISLDEAHIPKMPYLELIFNSKTMVEDLKTHLAVIRDYNQARIKLLELAKIKDAISEADLIKQLRELDPRMFPRTYAIGIQPEVHRLAYWNTFVQKHLQRAPEGLTGSLPVSHD